MLRLWREYGATAISGLFVVLAGVILAVGKPEDRPMAIATGGVFGLGFFVLMATHVLSAKARRRWDEKNLVEIVGGVAIPRRRGQLMMASIAIVLVGVLFAWGLHGRSPIAGLGGAALVVLGVGILIAIASGRLAGALRFEPEGLVVSETGAEFKVRWSDIERVDIVAVAGWPAVTVMTRSLEPILDSVQPSSARSRIQQRLATTLAWQGAPLMIIAHQYGIDAAHLAKAMLLYVSVPDARARLRQSRALGG